MSQLCIITDSSAHFPNPIYPGNNFVTIMPINIMVGDTIIPDSKDPKDQKKWFSKNGTHNPKIIAPSVDDFCRIFHQCGQKHLNIIAILHSSQLSDTYKNASKAAKIVKNSTPIQVIDSQTTGAGLGLLVQAAAEGAAKYTNLEPDVEEICNMLRGLVTRVYTVFFIPNMNTLAHTGHLDPAQAIIGEMLGIIPFYVMESGRLVSVQKARNTRQLVDMLFEFVSEFSNLNHLALLQGYPPYEQEIRSLRDRISNVYPEVPLTEHHLSLSLLSLLGPRSLGLVAMENTESF